ncbi:MAG: hydrogenase nickel incorporation protein HypB [Candidatus Kryptoniota bacterium]
MSIVTIERKVLERNDELAQQNRLLFAGNAIFVINIVSSPGSGKTSLLERTLDHLKDKVKVAVVEGDVQTDLDARRVAKFGVPVVQIVTNGGCHLDAKLVHDAIANIDLKNIELLVIENVGNLVCPAGYDLGEAMKVVIASTTEGDDKPLKYPAMFRNASVLVVNKVDLVSYVNCNLGRLKNNALQINPNLEVFETSCTTDAGIPEWSDWLLNKTKKH